MPANRKVYQVVLSLFLFYFVVYAVSPLSHMGPVNAADGHVYVEQRKSVSFKSAEIFFLEILLSSFNDREDADNSTSRFVLFKKIRAVVQSLTDAKYKLVKISGNVENQSVSDVVLFTIAEVRGSSPKPYHGFLAVFSGLSPPAA
jgi:hypothetical protein